MCKLAHNQKYSDSYNYALQSITFKKSSITQTLASLRAFTPWSYIKASVTAKDMKSFIS